MVGRTPALSRSVDTASEAETGPETAPSSFTPVEPVVRSTAGAASSDVLKATAGSEQIRRTSLQADHHDDDCDDDADEGWIAVERVSGLAPTPSMEPGKRSAAREMIAPVKHEDEDDEGEMIFWNDAD